MEVISLAFGETLRHGELQASDFLEVSGAQRGPRIVDKLLLHCERGIDPFVNSTALRGTYPPKIDSSYECRAKSHAAEHFDERSGESLGGAPSGPSELAHQTLLVHSAQLPAEALSNTTRRSR